MKSSVLIGGESFSVRVRLREAPFGQANADDNLDDRTGSLGLKVKKYFNENLWLQRYLVFKVLRYLEVALS